MLIWLLLISCTVTFEVQAQSFASQLTGKGNHNTLNVHNVSTQSSPSEDCNLCIIEAPGGVSLIYWAPEVANATSNDNGANVAGADEPYTQVEAGFTFTSPSVYVVYSSLQATYDCNNGPVQTLGAAYQRKTIEYSSRFLAYGTLSSPDQRCDENVVVGGFHTIDFSDLYYHPITISTTSKIGCPPYVNPRLSMPADLTDVDPAWRSCQPLYYGAFDPPRVLTRVKGPLTPLSKPSKPTSTPASATDPIVTANQGIVLATHPAIQGQPVPAIPSSTSSQVEQAAIPTADAPTPPQSRTSSIPIIEPAGPASADKPLLASDSAIFELSQSQVTSVEALRSMRASPSPDPIPAFEQVSDIDPHSTNPHESKPQSSGTQSNEVQHGHPRDGLFIVPINVGKGITSTVLLAMPSPEPTGSEASVSGNDRNLPSHSPVDQAGPTSRIDDPDRGQGEQRTQPQHQGHFPGLASHILAGLSGTDPTDDGHGSAMGGDVLQGSIVVSPLTSSGVMYLASLEKPTPLGIGSYTVKVASDGGIIIGSQSVRPGQKTTVAGTSVSLGHNQLVIGTSTRELDAGALTSIDSEVSLHPDATVFGGGYITKTASELGHGIGTPVPKASSKLAGEAKPNQLFEIGDFLVTGTNAMYRLSEFPMTNGNQVNHITLGFVDGKDGPTLTRVVTIPTELASEWVAKPGSNRSETMLRSSSMVALTSNAIRTARQSRSSNSQGPPTQTCVPSGGAAPTSSGTSFVKSRNSIACSACVTLFVVALITIEHTL